MELYFKKDDRNLINAIKKRRNRIKIRYGKEKDSLCYDGNPPQAYFDGEKYEIVLFRKKIQKNKSLIAIAHEAGHLENLHREFLGNYNNMLLKDYYYLEYKAYLYGWCVLKKLVPEINISKEEWREYHKDLIENLKKRRSFNIS